MSVMPTSQLTCVPNIQPDKNLLKWSIAPVLFLFHIGAVAALRRV
jgi:hypothetical protein